MGSGFGATAGDRIAARGVMKVGPKDALRALAALLRYAETSMYAMRATNVTNNSAPTTMRVAGDARS
jgi:hypothetical protein